jgi:hypothetical protein
MLVDAGLADRDFKVLYDVVANACSSFVAGGDYSAIAPVVSWEAT